MTDSEIAWIGLDWGTSNLRAFAMDRSGSLIAQKTSSKGMGALEPDQFEPALIELIEPWLEDGRAMPVLACGMVGARQGWREADYRSVPCKPVSGHDLTYVDVSDRRLKVAILPGICQHQPADVMRGEETQIAGLLAHNPDFAGSICLPGTHSKWAKIDNGEVSAFQTFMTGEIFALLSKQSVLRHSIHSDGFDEAVFLKAASFAIAAPSAVPGELFKIRANSLLHDQTPDQAAARLSGLLIGQELAACGATTTSDPVAIIGAQDISSLYHKALEIAGIDATIIKSAKASLDGLRQVAKTILE